MITIKCCATCANYDDGTCTVDCHSTTADDWCPRWEEEVERRCGTCKHWSGGICAKIPWTKADDGACDEWSD